MRLTEAAENLQKRAAKSIQIGKENEARELLIQKKKLLQALEKSKNRIEVLDKLSAKVTEVENQISISAGLLSIFTTLLITFLTLLRFIGLWLLYLFLKFSPLTSLSNLEL